MRQSDVIHPAPPREPPLFEPSAALGILDGIVDRQPGTRAGSAWDAAWIACLSGSPRWAETARREFVRAMDRSGSGEGRTEL